MSSPEYNGLNPIPVGLECTPVQQVVAGDTGDAQQRQQPKVPGAIEFNIQTTLMGAEELLHHVKLTFPNSITMLPEIVNGDYGPVARAIGRQDVITWMTNFIDALRRRARKV